MKRCCLVVVALLTMSLFSEAQRWRTWTLDDALTKLNDKFSLYEGVYRDPKDPSTLISELTVSEAKDLLDSGYVVGGMLPKLNNCIHAVENGVSRVHILDGRMAHCLLLEIFTNKGIGTAILNQKESRYYDGEQ